MQNTEWSSGLFDICALGCGTCFYTTYCGPCSYADLRVAFTGEGWIGACLGAMLCIPCHHLCWHPELRRQIAMKHGKNVRLSRFCEIHDFATHTHAPSSPMILAMPALSDGAATVVLSSKKGSRSRATPVLGSRSSSEPSFLFFSMFCAFFPPPFVIRLYLLFPYSYLFSPHTVFELLQPR
jgi:hypothetical protein